MNFLDTLREQKQDGEAEWASKKAEVARQEAEVAAQRKAEEDLQRRQECERQLKQARDTLDGLPAAIRHAASKGLSYAVLSNGFVEEKAPPDRTSRRVVLNGKSYFLVDWMIPFYELCHEMNVPLTVVSERVNVGIGKVLNRTYNVLAVDLSRI